MNVCALTEPHRVEVRELPTPSPARGEILVRVRACALCTTEQRMFLGAQQVPLPFVAGHELAGVVEEIGPRTETDLRVGDHVAISLPACGGCYYCRRGFHGRCEAWHQRIWQGEVWGIMGLAEYYVASPDQLFKLSSDVALDAAALVEPLACAVHAARRAGIWLASDVLILGAGTMGLLNLLVAKRLGARVIAGDPDAARRVEAATLGADVVLDPAQESALATIRNLTGGRGVEVVVVATPSGTANELALAAVGKTGTVVLFASAYPAEPLTIDPNLVHKHEITILGTDDKGRDDFRIAAKLISEKVISVSPLIAARFPLQQCQEAFEAALQPGSYRVIVQP